MNYDLDDPLGDLLSDDGSSESLFESKRTKNTAASEKPPTKLKMENLFGMSADNSKHTSESLKPVPTLATVDSSGPSSLKKEIPKTAKTEIIPTKTVPKKKEIVFADDGDDDIFADLGFDPKKPKASKKSNILDDLLGLNEPKSVVATPLSVPSQPAKTATQSRPTTGKLSRESTFDKVDTNEATSGYAASSINRPKTTTTPTTTRRKSSGTTLNDPLGIFSSNAPSAESIPETTMAKKAASVDWLGLNSNISKSVPVTISTATKTESVPNITVFKQPPITQQTPTAVSNIFKPNLDQSAELFAASNIGTENSISNMKHQETQLIIATQMKNQEQALIEMQRKQQDLLNQQEQHFNNLLQKQVQRQSMLEQNIQRQQERINSHIHLLMAQPPTLSASMNSIADGSKEENGTLDKILEVELRADIKGLELEKLRLEDLLQNVKANHDQELELLETSHK